MAEFSDAKSGAYCMCTRERCSDECRTYRHFHPKPITRADRIRNMTDEELADFINSVEAEAIKRAGRYLTKTEIERGKAQRLDWLRQEVNDGKEEKEENQPAK
jgi:hypothetical protein